jgi:CRISPR/Cas system-associated exonuclease Cas4 (RecB family)
MIIRQSTIKQFMECSLRYKFASEGAPRSQSSAMSFGTAIHDAVYVMETEMSLDRAVARFLDLWDNLEAHGLAYDYLIPRNDHRSYREKGLQILRDWWALVQWDTTVVLGREYYFRVPTSNGHEIEGTVDKWGVRQLKDGTWVVVIIDYKTSAKQPTRDYLRNDVQFHTYSYASTRREFWEPLNNGLEMFMQFRNAPRHNEWVQLRTPRIVDAGIRTDVHFNRMQYAIEQIELSVATGIFVPDISGASCEYCEFREVCGLPSIEAEGMAA